MTSYLVNLIDKNEIIVFGDPDEKLSVSNVKYSDQRIFPDDTIESIKRKIISELDQPISYDEIYLVASIKTFLSKDALIKILTCNHGLTVSQERLITLCMNLKNNSTLIDLCSRVLNDDIDYENDLQSFLLEIQNKAEFIDVALGQTLQHDYPMPANPVRGVIHDSYLKKALPDLIKTKNKTVLLEYGIIHENVINVYFASDVLTPDDDETNKTIIKLYFPYLYEKGIFTVETLNTRKSELMSETTKLIDDNFLQHCNGVKLLHDVYNLRENPVDLNYIERGITSIHFVMKPSKHFSISLESLFKVLETDKQTPLIKITPPGQTEKMFRLYSPGFATNGKRIPLLTKPKILRLDNEIGKQNRIAIYMEQRIEGFVCEIICEIASNANIHVKATFRKALSYHTVYNNQIDSVLRECLNPVLIKTRSFLESTTGNSIELFCSIAVPTIEILNITYVSHLKETPMIQAKKIMGCISSVFNVIHETSSEITMRYKRVSNYNERIGTEAYINEQVRKEMTDDFIIEGLVKNRLAINEEAAQKILMNYLTEEKVLEATHKFNRNRTKQPGFLTILWRENTQLNIEINDINQIWYIRLLEIYIDSLIRISMYKEKKNETTRVPFSDLQKMCVRGQNMKTTMVVTEELNDDAAVLPLYDLVEDLSFDDQLQFERNQTETESVQDDADGGSSDDEFASLRDLILEEDDTSNTSNNSNTSGGAPRKNQTHSQRQMQPNDEEAVDYAPQSLKNPNPFENKLQNIEPILFLAKKSGNYDTYSTSCQSNIKRQPVVLSKDEYDKLNSDPETKPLLKDALEYGSDPDNKYYYMCPRYWSFKHRRPMTEKEIKDNNLESHIIGKKEKEVTRDKFIFEFNDYAKEHMNQKGYIQHYPGFLNTSVHPDGLCVPCCFKKKQDFSDLKACEDKLRSSKQKLMQGDSAVQAPRQAPGQSQSPPEELPVLSISDEAVPAVPVQKPNAPPEYIIGPDKFPIPAGRRGYLPQSIQKFFNYDNSSCNLQKTMVKGTKCLLRWGVQEWDKDQFGRDEKPSQLSELQSFIGCMAALRQDPVPKKISEMKKIILNGITLDSFITYQNGTLVETFHSMEKEVVVSIYKTTNYVRKMKSMAKGKSPEVTLKIENSIKKTISSYENFRKFIENDEVVIDHTYMWDIFTTFNPNIFMQKVGYNLIILEIPKDDNSDSLNIICPSSHYSNNHFDLKKMTVILIKEYNYYEPIFQFTYNGDDKVDMKTSFSLLAPNLMINLKVMIELIKDSIFPNCKPTNVIKSYDFKYNLLAPDIISILTSHGFIINQFVLNYESKIIGCVVEKQTKQKLRSGVIMTAASPLDNPNDVDLVMMDDPTIWTSYTETLDFLTFVSNETKRKIPCLPVLHVIDDANLIGIITETNQFVEINPYIPKSNIPFVKTKHPMNAIAYNTENINKIDATLQTTTQEDNDRIKYVNAINLEFNMYQTFRNSMRIIINKIENIDKKKQIEDILKDGFNHEERHIETIQQLMQICQEVGDPFITFTRFSEKALDKFINTQEFNASSKLFMECISHENRLEYQPNTCIRIQSEPNDDCNIIIPDINLVNKLNNYVVYYAKLADELLRYTRIRRFILSRSSSMHPHIQYNLNNEEIILFYSQITSYFKNLEPITGVVNQFAKHNTFYDVNPSLNANETPSNNYVFHDNEPKEMCQLHTVNPLVKSSAKYFPPSMKLLSYENAEGECTFQVVLSIIHQENSQYSDITVIDLKTILIAKYTELCQTNKVQLVNYYKHLITNRLALIANIETFIMNTFYFMTHLDLWIIAQHFKLPIVLFSAHQHHALIENKLPLLVLSTEKTVPSPLNSKTLNFYYIMTIGRVRDVAPTYSIVTNSSNDIKFSLDQSIQSDFVSEVMKQTTILFSTPQLDSVNNFISTYK